MERHVCRLRPITAWRTCVSLSRVSRPVRASWKKILLTSRQKESMRVICLWKYKSSFFQTFTRCKELDYGYCIWRSFFTGTSSLWESSLGSHTMSIFLPLSLLLGIRSVFYTSRSLLSIGDFYDLQYFTISSLANNSKVSTVDIGCRSQLSFTAIFFLRASFYENRLR